MISVNNLSKIYEGGFQALSQVDLEIMPGEIFALLGPNGAGKTTLISIICGLANASSGTITIGGHDHKTNYRHARSLVGLVPQELHVSSFETVWDTVSFSRGLFNKARDTEHIEKILKDLSLWDKRHNQIITLSGGMKRRVMIAKALSHEPKILFLDEPTAGVDVELRKDMWLKVHELRKSGVTIILTTHYIEEAEEMADRVGVINGGKIILVEEKVELMKKLGSKQLTIDLESPLPQLPPALQEFPLKVQGQQMIYTYDPKRQKGAISDLFAALISENIRFKELHTKQSSLEEIFVELVKKA